MTSRRCVLPPYVAPPGTPCRRRYRSFPAPGGVVRPAPWRRPGLTAIPRSVSPAVRGGIPGAVPSRYGGTPGSSGGPRPACYLGKVPVSCTAAAVNPDFGAALRGLRKARGLSLRRLGKLVSYSHTQVWEWETGRCQPTPENASRLDDALGGDGQLAAMVAAASDSVNADDCDRLGYVIDHPPRIDPAAVTSFAVILANQRHLEDQVGAGSLLVPVLGQLTIVEDLVRDARGAIRPAVVGQAAQWAQFAGWLHAATGQPGAARDWYARTLEWATEVADFDMIATALNMRGHMAWQVREPGSLIGLSAAAQRQPASPGVRALAAQQEARGHALVGEAEDVERKLDEAAVLAAAAAERPDREPPWIYFYNGHYLAMQPAWRIDCSAASSWPSSKFRPVSRRCQPRSVVPSGWAPMCCISQRLMRRPGTATRPSMQWRRPG